LADAEWLAAAGNDILDGLRPRSEFTSEQACACARTLRLINTQKSRNVLGLYREDQRLSVLVEIVPVFDPLALSAVLALLVSGHSLPASIARYVCDLKPLESAGSVRTLNLTGTGITDITPLGRLEGLVDLDLQSTRVSNLASLSSMTSLRRLNLSGTDVTDLSPLASLEGLEELRLEHTQVQDLSPLRALTALRRIELFRTFVRDFSPLADLPNLVAIDLPGGLGVRAPRFT
jgi:hypothetical protein